LPPAPLGVQVSTLAEQIAQAAWLRWTERADPAMHDLASRLTSLVLDRGMPTDPGLRLTIAVASQASDPSTELEAWLRLLASYQPGEKQWYEARFHSLRLMLVTEPDRARETYSQFTVLNPDLGIAPWNSMYAELFGSIGEKSVNNEPGSKP